MKGFNKDQQVVVIVLGIVLLLVFLFRTYHPTLWPIRSERSLHQSESFKGIVVEVTGKVKNPGIYIFEKAPVVDDAVHAAGGLLHGFYLDSDLPARVLKNGTHLLVTHRGHSKCVLKILDITPRKRLILGLRLDVNRLSADDLALVPGISSGLARRIVAYREEYGPFKSWEDLLPVKGIGRKNLERLKQYLSLD
nr:helix-hairpin-helix domain-containing protein [Desulfobacterales bacterium]